MRIRNFKKHTKLGKKTLNPAKQNSTGSITHKHQLLQAGIDSHYICESTGAIGADVIILL
jgi:hypothetical protein